MSSVDGLTNMYVRGLLLTACTFVLVTTVVQYDYMTYFLQGCNSVDGSTNTYVRRLLLTACPVVFVTTVVQYEYMPFLLQGCMNATRYSVHYWFANGCLTLVSRYLRQIERSDSCASST